MNESRATTTLSGELPEATDPQGMASCLFDALGDRSRVVIVQHLMLGEHRVVDLTAHLGLAQSTVSKHLACLVGCGLVTVRSQGRSSYYRLAFPEATRRLLLAAEEVLALTGQSVSLCPAHRQEHDREVD